MISFHRPFSRTTPTTTTISSSLGSPPKRTTCRHVSLLLLVLLLLLLPCAKAHDSSSDPLSSFSKAVTPKIPTTILPTSQHDTPSTHNTIPSHAVNAYADATTTTLHHLQSLQTFVPNTKDETHLPQKIKPPDSSTSSKPSPSQQRQLGGGHEDFQNMDIVEFVSTLVDTPMDEWSAIQFVVFVALLMVLGSLALCCCCSCFCRPFCSRGGCCGGGGSGCQDLLMCLCCYELCCRDGRDVDVCCGGGMAPYNLV